MLVEISPRPTGKAVTPGAPQLWVKGSPMNNHVRDCFFFDIIRTAVIGGTAGEERET